MGGRQLLASAGQDGTVRLWDPATAACTLTIPTHHAATAITWVGGRLAIGLSAGILVIDLRINA